jgi:hypothetical protein
MFQIVYDLYLLLSHLFFTTSSEIGNIICILLVRKKVLRRNINSACETPQKKERVVFLQIIVLATKSDQMHGDFDGSNGMWVICGTPVWVISQTLASLYDFVNSLYL